MLINKKRIKIGFIECAMLLASMFFLIGINCWFSACGPKSDGTYMTCHYAENMIVALSAVLFAASFVHLILPDIKVKIGMDLVIIPLCAVTAAVPSTLIKLCAYDAMVCNSKMKPAVLAFSLVILALSLLDIVLCLLAKRKEERGAELKAKIEQMGK